jgi:aspartokinase/homoserine dehydrogenase 1
MRVLKFGGTSVGTPEAIQKVVEIVRNLPDAKAVVVSAFGGTTDKLILAGSQAASANEAYRDTFKEIESRHIKAVETLIHTTRQSGVIANVKFMLNELEDILQGIFLVRELSSKTLDFIMSFGERLSAYIVAQAFLEKNVTASHIDARTLVKTDNNFGYAKVDFKQTDKLIQDYFQANPQGVKIITGFIGSTNQSETTTLGRGGSDYTGAIFAAALQAEVLEIWTDVDGMLTADPRKVTKAFKLDEISYEEAMELSYFGAKVIYPPSIQPAYLKQIPILIKNTFNPTDPGTMICKDAKTDDKPIRGVSSMNDIALITLSGGGIVGVPGSAMRVFRALATHSINVILISQASSEHSISIAVTSKSAEDAEAALQTEFSTELKAHQIEKISVEKDLTIIAVVGKKMKNTPGLAGKLFSALGKNGVNILAIAQGGSELNISLVINKENEKKALNVIHESFFLSGTKVINVFLVGAGLIGKTLLKQIDRQVGVLAERNAIDIKVVGIANSTKQLINPNGIDTSKWETLLAEGDKADLGTFVSQMIDANLPNSVFVDCTAHQEVASQYSTVLKASIAVVTPNKLAAAGEYSYYKMLKARAKQHNVKFLYETNVGAGLPVISTLNDLINSGDKILKIQAILSGTLNFLFNTVSKDRKLSDVVKEAQEKGYAEPDPRIDLFGADIARKITILAREAGYEIETKNVDIIPFLPKNCLESKTVDEFFTALKQYDDEFEAQRAAVEAEGKKYRVIAMLEDGKASISLQKVDNLSPFYFAQGSDNIIMFTTDRYKELPLMIKGPGAGAEVTAAGIFADIIRIQ